jgi:hypothetical protein
MEAFGKGVMWLLSLIALGFVALAIYIPYSEHRVESEAKAIVAEAEVNAQCARREHTEQRVINGRSYVKICGQWWPQ